MYAYIDETGNTGANLFDENQPLFMTGALITRKDFHEQFQGRILRIAQSIGKSSLHANELNQEQLEVATDELFNVFQQADAQFFVSIIEKKYLAAAKLVDTVFDPHDNLAVPRHIYSFRALRLMMVFRVASILTDDTVKLFWKSLMETNKDRATKCFVDSLLEIAQDVPNIIDSRTRELVSLAIKWAIEHHEEIQFHNTSKIARNGHIPNVAAMPILLGGIDHLAKDKGMEVSQIVHDQQSQFGTVLKEWHKQISNAAPDKIQWPGEEPFSIQSVLGSNFTFDVSADNAGLQAIDAVLWLLKRRKEGRNLGRKCSRLLSFFEKHCLKSELTFDYVGSFVEYEVRRINELPLTEEDLIRGKSFLNEAENVRIDRLKNN